MSRRRLRWTSVAMVLLAAGMMAGAGGSATAGASKPPAPTNLEATAYSRVVHLTWQPGSDDPGVTYRMYNLTLGWTSDRTGTSGRWGHGVNSGGLDTGKTYTFEVTAIDADGDESAPSNRVSVTIPPMGPPVNVQAVLDDVVVTVSWERPVELEPGALTIYSVRLNGALERKVTTRSDAVQVSIPRVNPGTTHEYTVQISRAPASDPAVVTVPPSQDTTPPTTPKANIGFDEECLSLVVEFDEESTDDTTAASEIRYEALGFDPISRELFVVAYDISSAGPMENFDPRAIRAVDEAGNRSGVDPLEFDFDC